MRRYAGTPIIVVVLMVGAATLVPRPVLAAGSGQYWLAAADGGVFAYGRAYHGSTGDRRLNSPVVDVASTTAGSGYWLVAGDGGVFSFGSARFSGSLGDIALNQPIVGMAATGSGAGYWLVASDGGVFAFGDAVFAGSLARLPLSAPVVGIVASSRGAGYWLVASDGGVFAFGDAPFLGSAAGRHLAAPIVAMGSAGVGYLLAGADGSVHAFGGASAKGSLAGTRLADPVVDIEMFSSGYWLVTAGGEVSAFGDAAEIGTGPRPPLAAPVVGMAAGTGLPDGDSILPGIYHERADEFSSVTYQDGAPGFVEVLHGDCFCRHRVWMAALWHPDGDGSAQLTAHLTNTAGVPLRFPDGLHVTFEATKDGAEWRRITAAAPAIRVLEPGAEARVSAAIAPDPNGHYSLTATTVVVVD
jgi:hypothetical protein